MCRCIELYKDRMIDVFQINVWGLLAKKVVEKKTHV